MSEFTPSVASPLERATGSETVSVDGFVAFIGNGYNQRGAFPRNLSELNDDLYEFARAAVLPSPEPT